jgi:xylulokinase
LPSDPVTHLYRSATETGWYGMGAILNGGLTLAWVCRVLGADWQELYAAAAADPRLDAPYFLPHLNGERTPYLDPDLRGAWTNLGPRHERTDLLRAALEGVAFAVRDALEHVLTASDALDHLRLAGGGTAEPAWRQLLADVLEHDLAPVEVPAASGLGAALLGSLAADLTDEPTLRSGRPRLSIVTTQPRGEYQALYRERYAAFIEKVSALRGATVRPACDAAATPSPWRRP